MIHIYTTPSCVSCRKAKKWFEERNIEYTEKNIFSIKLSKKDLQNILKFTLNGVFDIISNRSKVVSESKLDIEAMTLNELYDFIIENPSALRRPLIFDSENLQIGYNEDDIRMFIPKELKKLMICMNCLEVEECDKLFNMSAEERRKLIKNV